MPPTETLRAGSGSGERSGGNSEQTYIIRQSNKCYEHRDSQATAMSVDYSGQWVLLAGRGYLALQRLGQDDGTLRRHERQSKYEVSVAEFAICPSRREYCAIAVSADSLKCVTLIHHVFCMPSRLVKILTLCVGVPPSRTMRIRCVAIRAPLRTLTGTARIPICWLAARSTPSRTSGICAIRASRHYPLMPSACVTAILSNTFCLLDLNFPLFACSGCNSGWL